MDILLVLNQIIIGLNGTPLNSGDSLSNSRLESYALVVLFYKLNKEYPVFNITYAIQAINADIGIQDIIDHV